MMCKRYTSNNISDLSDRDVFFDANILIYLFFSTGRGQQQLERKYANIYGEILKRDIPKCINYIVLSELVNRVLRISWETYLHTNHLTKEKLNYKGYRDSAEGNEAQQEMATMINELILEQFDVIEDAFSKEDIKQFLEVDDLDFSDKAILKTCETKDFVLLTHDGDYADSYIDILTCNTKILQR